MKNLRNGNLNDTNGFHKSFDNFDTFTFKQTEVLIDKPIYIGFSVLIFIKYGWNIWWTIKAIYWFR